MHRPRHFHHAIALRLSSALLALAVLAGVGSLAFVATVFLTGHRDLLPWSLLGLLATALLLIGFWIQAHSARCPLCHGQALLGHNCSHHRKARKLVGSYRFRVATSILFLNRFRCPYCGEATRCVPRKGYQMGEPTPPSQGEPTPPPEPPR